MIRHTELHNFWNFVHERHSVYLNRTAGMTWPWTEDRILREWRFCNVFRELDTVTRWIAANYRTRTRERDLWFAMVVARLINWPPTLEAIAPYLFPWKPALVVRTMNELAARGEKVYTSAYMLRGDTNGRYATKPEYTVFGILDRIHQHRERLRPEMSDTLQRAWTALQACHGLGGFLAYEVVTDLRHMPQYLVNAPDINTWAYAGPGAVRGLNRLHGLPVPRSHSWGWSLSEMREVLSSQDHGYRREWLPRLELRDVEHSLCEFDKYERVRRGEGQPRQRYRPPPMV